MPRVLIVEDDAKIVRAIEKTLSLGEGFVAVRVGRADEAVAAAVKHKPDLVLLDVRLPGGDGRVVLRELKGNASVRAIPVIMLTGMSSEGDKVMALNLGADDYVVKPFGAMELLARVQAVLRRSRAGGAPESEVLVVGALTLDRGNRAASFGRRALKLQPKEFEILFLLAAQAGRAVSRTYLIENSSSYGLPVPTRSLDTHIKNLRKKLGDPALIETVPKLGYRLRADA